MWWPSASDTLSPGSTLGVLLLATIIAALIYGATFLQTIHYFDRYHNDPLIVKFLVMTLWLFDTVTMVLEVRTVYVYTVNFGGTQFADVPIPWSLPMERAFSGFLAISAIGLGLTSTVEEAKRGLNAPSPPLFFFVLSTTSAALQITVDIVIVMSLYWLCRNRAGNMSPRERVRHVLLCAVNRGIFSTILQALTTIAYFALRPKLVWIAFHLASSKIHALLNTRSSVDGFGHDVEIVDARVRYRLEHELARVRSHMDSEFTSRTESPPVIPSTVVYDASSEQRSWFSHSDKSDEGFSHMGPT
ncbi:uncharacterized protein BXZ73DRAFT_101074 [Epithele typhae]|uniref:uncharacterized protein n=1 Tax=Epithele typhae TaxID=378194 RepID=UPI00200875F2|nr:uncharacterized protein BXZ73DRAFT_101074 [Epithele typhae]KAH9933104.1 hypothetical protein BXZ73DRAFT_101074 [Epithele typhae]